MNRTGSGVRRASAPRGRGDDFEEDIDLDSAGDRFGAMPKGGRRRAIFRVAYFRETVARNEVEGAKVLSGITF